jgi:Ca2+-binding EF-hand superfamily protein
LIGTAQVPPGSVQSLQIGQLDREEFLSIPQIANNPLALRMIAIFDEDGDGSVDFQEFIAGLSAFSSKGNKQEKLKCNSPTNPGHFYVYHIEADGQLPLRCTIWIATDISQMASYSLF